MEPDDWKANLRPDIRQKIVNGLFELLIRPHHDPDLISRMRPLAISIEADIYKIATSKSDYLNKIDEHAYLVELCSSFLLPRDKDSTDTSDWSPPPPNEDSTMENEATGKLRPLDKIEEEELAAKMETLQVSLRAGDKSAMENFIVNLFEGDDAFEEFVLDQEANLEGEEEASEASQPWQDEWDDYDDGDDFSVRLKRELEKNKPKE